ncbi:glycoside hydrolase family 99-like domain-containing protein [Shewanella sp. C32]|uniref:Glycoside hydrolase family 99-like domain-containing protein n=1 Tax=Shewanella electrica TaxID=515560 RepID=A0ABT2FJK0_9GAMM|nr:glycoside hydrolase family 99-like domain-containing protein [Shewanella electrica]MCH1924612.1 glycoside hydrolase family 99-like domain-containing protein [Shewanella electrica]MCS4556513.1 glycoside hydrolase family 99-like domain-containing protein [Shewanella electrica]
MTKVVAFYLPQFHQIPENDKWWGEGFTEWTNVKKAKPLFNGHNQPRIPLNNNYYDLSSAKTLEWQASLMNNYGIDGMCFYHYWFGGKTLLEKPLENLLENPSINMPFCLAWANEPWTRAWDGGDKEVIMEQHYGSQSDWEAHFDYLYNAFKDIRYLTYEGKPIFIIYRAQSIPDLEKMLIFWQELAKNKGLSGIHFVRMNTGFSNEQCGLSGITAQLDFEPMYSLTHSLKLVSRIRRFLRKRFRIFLNLFLERKLPIDVVDYQAIWDQILARDITGNTYPGAFVGWDNTPRKGSRGLIVKGSSAGNFRKNFTIQYNRCVESNAEFIFINAWNEWAEGTYLEPDIENQYEYLEVIRNVKADNDIN